MTSPRDPDAHQAATAGLPTGQQPRTWNTPGGPMVEPQPDPAIDERVAAVLNALAPTARAVLKRAGRRISDQLAAEALARRDRIDASHTVSAAMCAAGMHATDYVPAAEIERRRSTFNGELDQRHLELRAATDRAHEQRTRRRRRAA